MSSTSTVRALVVYESMFGNTRAVAEAVAEGLRVEGLDVTLAHVHDAPAGQCDCDLLVVGAPTHAFSLSRPSTREDAVRQGAPATAAAGTGLREWISALKQSAGDDTRTAATFDTRVTKVRRIPKAASTRAARLLSRVGFRLVSRPTGFLVSDTAGPLEAGELERATAWGRSVALAARA